MFKRIRILFGCICWGQITSESYPANDTRYLTLKYNFCYTLAVKTAISIPDKVFESAEKLASRLGKSRSQLYTQALDSYVMKHRNDNLTKELDEVYSTTDSQLDAGLASLQYKSLSKDKW
jgi:antitoxin MazE6